MNRILQTSICALGLGLALAAAAFAGHDTALGSDGTIFQVRTGLYGDLFPAGKAADKTITVVALDVTKPGAPAQRLLVPGTDGFEVESSPSVVFEDDSQTVFLLWESAINVHPVLELSGFDGTNWLPSITVTGNPFAVKTSPQFVLTRDSYDLTGAGGTTTTRHRTILHLLWQEAGAGTQVRTFYSPVIINDGQYIGWNPLYDLDDFLPAVPAGAAAPADVQTAVTGAPLIQGGRDERTVVAAYASTARGQMATVEIDVLPEQLMQLADKARSHIIDIGRASYPNDLPSLAEKARSHIIDIGRAFHPEIGASIADQVKADILADTSGDLPTLATKARSHIIDIGAKLSGRGLRPTLGDDQDAQIVEVDGSPIAQAAAALPDATQSPYHLLQIRTVNTWPAPRVGPGTVKVFVSQSGADLIISWAQGDRVLYRNSQNGGWSDPRTLLFSDSLSLQKSYDILDQRIRNR
ncbi:MAG TPA: hypothetical protein VIJ26_02345 [Thermoanaerobaculia bacterium]